jgi:ribosomal protein L31E
VNNKKGGSLREQITRYSRKLASTNSKLRRALSKLEECQIEVWRQKKINEELWERYVELQRMKIKPLKSNTISPAERTTKTVIGHLRTLRDTVVTMKPADFDERGKYELRSQLNDEIMRLEGI